jgi:hypothetical protein
MSLESQLRVEMHCHTVYSHDGHIEFNDLLAAAARHRLDVICITDHDTIEGACEFQRRATAQGERLQIVIGEERTLSDGSHVIGLFLKHPISSQTFDDAVAEIREQGGLCTLPHPFRHRDGILRQGEPSLAGVFGFEIFNPKCSSKENEKARALRTSGLVPLGGSDAHYQGDLGQCVALMPYHVDLRESLDQVFQRREPHQVLGIQQEDGDPGRRYVPLYYRIKPYVRVPRPLVPAANELYSAYQNTTARWRTPRLEIKYAGD